jgi:hypothetical protein
MTYAHRSYQWATIPNDVTFSYSNDEVVPVFLMYVDESGDVGLINSPSRYFVLTGLVVHELRWKEYLDQIIAFRQRMKQIYGLNMRDEIHASEMIRGPGKLAYIKRNDRLGIIRAFAKELSVMPDINIINIVVDKHHKPADYDVFAKAWIVLIQRFENTLSRRNFRGPANPDDRGMIFPDRTDDKKLTQLLRRLRHYNPIPNQPAYGAGYRNLRISTIVEDPNFRDSAHSLYIQAADTAAYLISQKLQPNKYMRKKSGHNYFDLLDAVLCKVASTTDPQGIVML